MTFSQAVPTNRLAMLLVLLGGGAACADGKFFPLVAVADEPGIEAQRGLVVYRDGVETLIVQSDVTGGGDALGWLLPLPAEPTSIKACTPNALTGLARVVSPEVAVFPSSTLGLAILWTLLLIVGCLLEVHQRRLGKTRVTPLGYSLVAVAVFVTAILNVTFLGGRPSNSVNVLQTSKAGIYDVTVISDDSGAVVNNWLSSNGFATTRGADSVIEKYVANDWCFLAAKISPEVRGHVPHHPLSVTFSTEQAVYPMRLTGVESEPIQLDLFVIGDRRALVRPMKTWMSDTFIRGAANERFKAYRQTTPPVYESRAFSQIKFGIPNVSDIMWPGCTLTRLHARLDPDDMKADLNIRWSLPTATRAKVYSLNSALAWGGIVAAVTFMALLLCFTSSAVKQGRSASTLVQHKLPIAILLGLAIGGAWFLSLEVVHVESNESRHVPSVFVGMNHARALRSVAMSPPGLGFPSVYADQVKSTALPLHSSLEAPGDYHIEASGDGWGLTIIDWPFIQVTIPISSNGVPYRAD